MSDVKNRKGKEGDKQKTTARTVDGKCHHSGTQWRNGLSVQPYCVSMASGKGLGWSKRYML